MTGSGNQRTNALRRGLSASSGSGGTGGSSAGASAAAGGTSSNGGYGVGSSGSGIGTSQEYMDALTDEQRRILRRKIDALRAIEQDVERLKEDRLHGATRRLGLSSMATVGALSVFTQTADWQRLASSQGSVGASTPWAMIKRAVAEEEKYQSKKNWSSTKGRGNRKAPVARRLDVEVLKRFGVYSERQFPQLATCDSCERLVNAHMLKEHQENNCTVSAIKKDDKKAMAARAKEREEKEARAKAKTKAKEAGAGAGAGAGTDESGSAASGTKRLASEALDDEPAKAAKPSKMTKKERMRLEKKQREKERLERREQLRVEKERKRQEKEAKRERELAKARMPVDLDKQCGVIAEPGAGACTRSLTCKTHSMAMKRSVVGRSKLFDALLQAHLAKSRSAAAAKNAASRNAAGSAQSVRNAANVALVGEDGRLEAGFFDDDDADDDADGGSDEEAERLLEAMACARGRPLAVRPAMMPRRRHHYLRVRDLFFDALKPPIGAAEQPESLAT
ncbi:SAGA complex subunit Sgf73 [Coemansia sp. Benny D115]|nr:SAGA complex subunit Sgf73 [Coemansia sp. Benny D115]